MNITTEDTGEDGIRAVHAGGTSTTSADITIDVTGTTTNNTISTSGSSSEGIYGEHSGTGDVDIDVEDVTITTTGQGSKGIQAKHSGTGDVDIDATGVSVSTTGAANSNSEGVIANHTGTGDITVNIQGKTTGMTTTPSTITTTNNHSVGIFAQQVPTTGKTGGDIAITLGDTQINTSGSNAFGVQAQHQSPSSGTLTATLNSGTTITTAGQGASAVNLSHENTDKMGTDNTANSVTLTTGEITVRTMGQSAHGLRATRQHGHGDVTINVDGSTIITEGNGAIGIYGYHAGDDNNGALTIDARNGSVTTGSVAIAEDDSRTPQGYTAFGILAHHQNTVSGNTDGAGDIRITTRNFDVTTTGTADHPNAALDGPYAYGIYAIHRRSGNVVIDIQQDSSVTTHGQNSHGVVAYHYGTKAARSMDITIGGPITVSGTDAQGVRVGTVSAAGVPSRMAALDNDGYRRQTVTVNGPISSAGEGIYLTNGGRVIINRGDDPGTTMVTENYMGSIDSASGIAILATGTVPGPDPTDPNTAATPPKLRVDLNLNGARLSEAIGDGDWIINDGGQTTIAVNGTLLHDGATGYKEVSVPNGAYNIWIRANGVNVQSHTGTSPASWTVSTRAAGLIQDRDFSFSSTAHESDLMETQGTPPSSFEPPPPPRPVSSTPPPSEPEPERMQVNEEIVADEDEMAAVHIEGDGTVHIGPQGSLRAASGIAILASGTTPELTVDLDLDGRTVSQVIGDDWIINDGGGTTINVNGVTLHDATTGVVPGAIAPNGAYNVRTEGPGVRVRQAGVRILDRSDPNPANWRISDPEEGVIADRDFSATDFIREAGTGPEPTPPMMIEEYAPRAAVYEALPNVLLGLQERTPTAARTRQPFWFRVTGHTGSQDFGRSSVGAEYDIDYFKAEAGKHFTLASGTEVWATLQYLDATAEVDSPVQGGDIDIQGLELALQLCRGCKDAEKYISGEVSLGRYDLDLDSDTRGKLKQGVGATSYALALEAGRRLQRGTYILSPRLRLDHASVSIDRFTDSMKMPTRVSYPDADRLAIALGVQAETAPNPQIKNGLSLWGSLDLEHRLDDAQTTARVSGKKLSARTGDHSILLGLGGTWQRDRLKVNAGLSAREGLDGGSESYGASLDLALLF